MNKNEKAKFNTKLDNSKTDLDEEIKQSIKSKDDLLQSVSSLEVSIKNVNRLVERMNDTINELKNSANKKK